MKKFVIFLIGIFILTGTALCAENTTEGSNYYKVFYSSECLCGCLNPGSFGYWNSENEEFDFSISVKEGTTVIKALILPNSGHEFKYLQYNNEIHRGYKMGEIVYIQVPAITKNTSVVAVFDRISDAALSSKNDSDLFLIGQKFPLSLDGGKTYQDATISASEPSEDSLYVEEYNMAFPLTSKYHLTPYAVDDNGDDSVIYSIFEEHSGGTITNGGCCEKCGLQYVIQGIEGTKVDTTKTNTTTVENEDDTQAQGTGTLTENVDETTPEYLFDDYKALKQNQSGVNYSWAYDTVKNMKALGFLKGNPNSNGGYNLLPDGDYTALQMLAMMARVMKAQDYKVSDLNEVYMYGDISNAKEWNW